MREEAGSGSDPSLVESIWALRGSDICHELAHRKRVVALLFVLFVGIGIAYILLAKPVYRVSTVLIPAESQAGSLNMMLRGPLGDLASLAGASMGSRDDETIEALAILQSRRFVMDFIRDWNLMPVLFADRWDTAGKQWKTGNWPFMHRRPPSEAEAFTYFDEKVRELSQDKKTSLVTLSIDWPDRTAAVAWANELVRRINEEMRARAIAESSAILERLQNQIAQAKVISVEQSLAQLIEAQVKRKIFATTRADYVFRVVDPPTIPDDSDVESPRAGFVIGLSMMLAALASFLVLIVGAGARKGIQA